LYRKTRRTPFLDRTRVGHYTSNMLLLSLFRKLSKTTTLQEMKNYSWNNISWSTTTTRERKFFEV